MRSRYIVFSIFLGLSSLALAATSQDYYQAGTTLYGQGKWDTAIQYYQAAIQLDPVNWQAYQGLGNTYYRTGKKEEALAAYRKSLAIHPNNPPLQQFVDRASPPQQGPSTASAANFSTNEPAQPAPLTKPGKVIWSLGFGATVLDFGDLTNFYGPSLVSSSTETSVNPFLGADYCLDANFQAGIRLEGMIKKPETIDVTGYGYTQKDQWTESNVGGALTGSYMFHLDPTNNIILHLEAGYYTLLASTLQYVETYSSGSVSSGTFNLSASGIGGRLGLSYEMIKTMNIGLGIGLGYRFLTFSPVTAMWTFAGATKSATLVSYGGAGNNYSDFSGPEVLATVRFY